MVKAEFCELDVEQIRLLFPKIYSEASEIELREFSLFHCGADNWEQFIKHQRFGFGIKIDGEFVLVGGIVDCFKGWEIQQEINVIWAISSTKIDQNARLAASKTRQYFRQYSVNYKNLFNYCLAENHKTIKWLKYLGFRFNGVYIYVCGERFVKFEWSRNVFT